MIKNDETSETLFRNTGFMFTSLSGACLLVLIVSRIFGITFPGRTAPPSISAVVVVSVCVLFFAVSTISPSLHWIQPVIFLAVSPLPLMVHADSIFSVGAFICGIILLFKLDFFKRARFPKVLMMLGYYALSHLLAGLVSGTHALYILLSSLFSVLFLVFLLLVYREKVVIYLSSPRPILSLSDMGITQTEALYLRSLLAGSSVKEIASDSGVKESTVRNTLARVYRKFEVTDKSALFAKCEHYDLVD